MKQYDKYGDEVEELLDKATKKLKKLCSHEDKD